MSEQHHVGLDVSVKETAICIVDPHGKVVHRATVESHPEVIGRHLIDLGHSYARIGLEAGPLSPWLYAGLVEAGLPAICVETRHMHAALSARINKTDRNDAMGIAQMMRVGLFKPVHVKTPASQQRRLLLTSRKLLQRKAYDIESDLRGQLRNFALKVGVVGAAGFVQRVRDLVLDLPFVAAVVLPLLEARSALRTQLAKLHKMLLDQVRTDPVCPALDDRARRRAGRGVDLPYLRRQPGPLRPIAVCRGALWSNAAALPVRRDDAGRPNLKVRRHDDARRTV